MLLDLLWSLSSSNCRGSYSYLLRAHAAFDPGKAADLRLQDRGRWILKQIPFAETLAFPSGLCHAANSMFPDNCACCGIVFCVFQIQNHEREFLGWNIAVPSVLEVGD